METPPTPTRFPDLLGLAELPYFEVKGGRLVLADPELGPAADVHTHLALSYLGRPRVDLQREHPRTEHYLPADRAIDLEVYMNRNFVGDDVGRLTQDLTWKSATPWGMRRTHTAPNLTREMTDVGVACSVLLPIDFPLISSNAEAFLEVAGKSHSLVSLGSVHPYDPWLRSKLEAQRARGARGIKFHPNAQLVPPEDSRAMELYRHCGELGLPLFFHAGPVGIEGEGGRKRTQMQRYEAPIRENPRTTFILGHSGALQMEIALELCRRYENCWLETSSQALTNVREIVARAPGERVMHGSDWPFYPIAVSLAKVLIATEGQAALRRAILWDNAARLFGLPRA